MHIVDSKGFPQLSKLLTCVCFSCLALLPNNNGMTSEMQSPHIGRLCQTHNQKSHSLRSVALMHFQTRIAGDIAGPSGGQGSSAHPEKPLIKEDNALATLQAAFPKEVKYKTIKGPPSRSAQMYAFCTTSHELTGKFGDSMMSHQESCPFVVKLCQSCCNNHQASMQHE